MSQNSHEWRTEDKQTPFPIRILSIKTGVNSVTLRAWERRYGLLKPKRTEKGHRLYSDSDVARVEAIVRWIKQGVAVSKVRALLDQDGGAENITPTNEWLEWQVALVKAALVFDEAKIEHLYQQVFSQYPPLIATQYWVLPSLEQLGVGTHYRFCESALIRCLTSRLSTLKNQHNTASTLLITGFYSQRTLWCYLVSAIVNDHGFSCRVLPNMASIDDWPTLIEGMEPKAIIAFCESDLAPNSMSLMKTLAAWNKPISVIGASIWLAVNENKMTSFKQVSVYSDPLEGLMAILDKVES